MSFRRTKVKYSSSSFGVYDIFIRSNDLAWVFRKDTPVEGHPNHIVLAQGRGIDLKTSPRASNQMLIVVHEHQALLFVNDIFVTMLDLPDHSQRGDIGLVTGLEHGQIVPEHKTQYSDLALYSLDG